jgi:transcriptional regulator with XRE-family HTH domain
MTAPQQWHEFRLDFQPIRDALAEAHVRQSDYAKALGITEKHVSRVLNGIDTPTVRLLVEMARQVGLVWRLMPADNRYEPEAADGR